MVRVWSKCFLLAPTMKKVANKFADYQANYPDDYLAIYDLPLDTELNQLAHYPSVAIEKGDFE